MTDKPKAILNEENALLRSELDRLRSERSHYKQIFQASPDAIVVTDHEGSLLEANHMAREIFGQETVDDVPTNVLKSYKNANDRAKLLAALEADGIVTGFETELKRQDGSVMPASINSSLISYQGRQAIMSTILDITEKKAAQQQIGLNEIRFEALYNLSRMNNESEKSILDYALEQCVRITESEIGYIYFVSDDETELTLHAWSKAVMPQCAVENAQTTYMVAETGIWGDAIRNRGPAITNDYANHPGRRGYPKGHVSIIRHMNVPLFEDERIVLLVGVGNKATDYLEEDARQLSLISEGMWSIIRRKQIRESLEQAHDELERRIAERTKEVTRANENLIRINKELEQEVAIRRHIEEQVTSFTNRLSLAARASGVGVWEWNILTDELVWDDRMLEIYQVGKEQFSGTNEAWRTRVHPDDLPGVEALLRKAMDQEITFSTEFRIVWPNGEIRHIESNALVQFSNEGTAQSMTGTNLDVTERKRTEEGLRRTEKILSTTPDMVSMVNSSYEYVMVNDSYLKAFRIPREGLEGKHIADILGWDNFEAYSKPKIDKALAGATDSFEAWLTLPNYGRRFFAVTYHPVDSGGADGRYAAIHARDLTSMKQAETDRQRIFDVSADMLCIAGFDGWFRELNPAWKRTLGWSELELKSKQWVEFVHEDDRENARALEKAIIAGEPREQFECRFHCKDGRSRWLSWNAYPDMDRELIIAAVRDVTEQKRLMEELTRLASTDPLTGAYNRRSFFELAQAELDRFQRYGGGLAVVMLDIDHFKTINDNYGHDAGDYVLKQVVATCQDTLRTSDIFARIGGEEFAAILIQSDPDKAKQTANRLLSELGGLMLRKGEHTIRFTVSIGMTLITRDSPSLEGALKRADDCLYRAKQEGRNRVVWDC